MNSKAVSWTLRIIGLLALAVSLGALAQTPAPMHLSGLINDYTPETINGSVVGPWEIRGEWSLNVPADPGAANFSAYLTMERSDYWIFLNPGDVDNPASRSPHTHHIMLVGGVVTPITNGFKVTGGTLRVTGNGNAVFPNSALEVDITGGGAVARSNVVLKFTGDAAGHFGSQAIHGVVALTGPPPANP
jgi:hypothetical protein